MNLTFRQATPDDVAAFAAHGSHCFGNDADLLSRLPEVWRQLLPAGRMVATVVEERDCRPTSRVVAVGASVFVSDEFAAAAKRSSPPPLGAALIRAVLRGESAVPQFDALRAANAARGLNLCVLAYEAGRRSLPLEQFYPVFEKMVEAFFYLHRGYRVKEMLQEVYGPPDLEWMLKSGVYLRTDYAGHFADHPGEAPVRERHPYLTGITREEVLAIEGSRIFPLFVDAPAHFGFTPPEQELLRHALTGQTDVEIAATVIASHSTIKKRWLAIYDLVAAVDAHILPALPAGHLNEHHRGFEKRRHLLNYLHDHPEELLPIHAGRKSAQCRASGNSEDLE